MPAPSPSNPSSGGCNEPEFTDDRSANMQSKAAELTTSPINGPASAMIGSVAEDENYLGQFGSSSTGSFITIVRRAVDRTMGFTRQKPDVVTLNPDAPNSSNAERWTKDESKQSGDAYLLPRRTRADSLMTIYWNQLYPLYPFVDQKDLTTRYNNLWNGQDTPGDESEFLCMLNTIFAVSTQIDATISAEERKSVAGAFFKRARDLLDLWRPGSVQMVQLFLLLAQYLQTTNEPHQCWMFVGYAVRTAESLGLNLPETTDRMSSIAQQEVCRRVWHSCIHMDRILAMTYGRPTMIKHLVAVHAPRPLCLDDENFPSDKTAELPAVDTPQIMDFFIHSLDLFEILNEILEEFYDPRSRQKPSSTDEHAIYFAASLSHGRGLSILDMDQKLSNWEQSLSEHLRNYGAASEIYAQEQGPSRKVVLARQAVILRQRQANSSNLPPPLLLFCLF